MNAYSEPTLAFWSDSEPLECVSRLPETPDVVTFTFQAPSGAFFAYKPGQFVTLELPVPGGSIHRTYTISSSPSRPNSLTITVKAQTASLGTRGMLDNLHPGIRLRATGPAGSLSCADHPSEKYLFVSAGSGITPMMSMTTHMYDSGRDPDIVFVDCARRPSEIVFRGRVEHTASRITGIELARVVERTDPYQPWTGYRGTFDQLVLGLVAPDYQEREVFCCGPEPVMQAVREALYGLGYDMDRYHQESFHPPARDGRRSPRGRARRRRDGAGRVHRLRKVGEGALDRDAPGRGQKTGALIPSGCTFGVCGTCKIRKTAGRVHMVHNGGITEESIAEGYVLACCTNPIGKVTLDA